MKKSTKNQIKAEFFEFLRENDCASKFCVNFYSKEGKSFRNSNFSFTNKTENITQHLNKSQPNEWITEAFRWGGSTEKFDYWDNRHIKWALRLKAIKYNIQKSKDETNSH